MEQEAGLLSLSLSENTDVVVVDDKGERGGGPAASHLPVGDHLSQEPPRLARHRRARRNVRLGRHSQHVDQVERPPG